MGNSAPTATLLGLSLMIVAGCGGKEKPVLLSVSGRVTYEDGSPVPASQMELKLIPSPKLREEFGLPIEFSARVSTRDGRWVQADRLPVGEYEVEVVRLGTEESPGGFQPVVYGGDKVQPSKIAVNPGAVDFEITIPRER